MAQVAPSPTDAIYAKLSDAGITGDDVRVESFDQHAEITIMRPGLSKRRMAESAFSGWRRIPGIVDNVIPTYEHEYTPVAGAFISLSWELTSTLEIEIVAWMRERRGTYGQKHRLPKKYQYAGADNVFFISTKMSRYREAEYVARTTTLWKRKAGNGRPPESRKERYGARLEQRTDNDNNSESIEVGSAIQIARIIATGLVEDGMAE
jgi:hypothetical protein